MAMTCNRFEDIPQLTPWGSYRADIIWPMLESNLRDLGGKYGLDLNPDYQRGHVWNEGQQVRFVEFILRGGRSGHDILFNQPGFHMGGRRGCPVQIVDGLQRLTAVRRFLANEIPAFGTLYGDYEDKLTLSGPRFTFHVNHLNTRAEVLRWYLDLNAGGTPHSEEEIHRVRGLLAAEEAP